MSLSIRQIHPVFVGEVSGVDCREPLGPDAVAAILRLIVHGGRPFQLEERHV